MFCGEARAIYRSMAIDSTSHARRSYCTDTGSERRTTWFGRPVFTRLHNVRNSNDGSNLSLRSTLAYLHERGFCACLLSGMHVVIALHGKFPITSQPAGPTRLCIDAGKPWWNKL
jgi:hypothetical protein